LYNIWASIKYYCTPLPVETRAPVTGEDEIEFAERVVPGSPVSSTTRSWIHVSPNNLGPNRTPKRHTSENVNLYTYEIKKNKVLKYELHLKSFYHFPKLLKKHQKKRTIFPAVVFSGKYRNFYETEKQKKLTPKLKKKWTLLL
jgi:hypothetical protein